MTRGTPLSDVSLMLRHLRAGMVPALLVASLVFSGVLAVALTPRALLVLGNDELRTTLAGVSPLLRDLSGTGRLGTPEWTPEAVDGFLQITDSAIADFPDSVPEPLRDALGEPRWVAQTSAADAFPPVELRQRTLLSVTADLRRDEVVRFVDGGPPTLWEAPEDRSPESDEVQPIEIAVSEALADMLQVRVGDLIDRDTAPYRVSGIYTARDPAARYWVYLPDLRTPRITQSSGELPTLRASVYVDPLTIAGLPDDFSGGQVTAWVPVDPAKVSYSQIEQIQPQAREVIATRVNLPRNGTIDMRTGLADAVDEVVVRVSAVTTLLALVGSGLLGVLVAVLALGVRIVEQRRQHAVTLALARGAGPWRVRAVMLLEGLLVAVPAGAVATVLAAVLLPVDVGLAGWLLPALATLTVPILFAALTSTRPQGRERGDLTVQSRSPIRWVVEVAVVGLAAVSLLLLARRGIVGTSVAVGVDPLLAAMPLLLAAAVCVVVLRVYPAPMLAVEAAARRGRSATGLVGAARGVRDPSLGFPAVLALVVGVAVVVAAITLGTTVRGALDRAAVEVVGADVRVTASTVPDSVVERAAEVEGVAAAASVAIADEVPFRDAAGTDELFLVIADTAALNAVRPDLPELEAGRQVVEIVPSDDWVESVVGTEYDLAGAPAALGDPLPRESVPGTARTWALVDRADLDRLDIEAPEARQLLLRLDAGADVGAVSDAVRRLVGEAQRTETARADVEVSSVEAERAAALAVPSVGGLERFLALTAIAALLLTVVAILLASITGAAARGRVLAILRVLGLSRRQVRRLLTWEFAPVAVLAAVVGTGLGLVLPGVIAMALDLRPFVGGAQQPGVVIDPLLVAGGVAAFLLTVLVAGAVAAAIGRRIVPAGALKMGDA